MLAFVAEPGARSRLTIASYDQHAARLASILGSVRLADLTAAAESSPMTRANPHSTARAT